MYVFGDMPGANDYVNAANGFMADRFLFGTDIRCCRSKTESNVSEFPLKESVIDKLL